MLLFLLVLHCTIYTKTSTCIRNHGTYNTVLFEFLWRLAEIPLFLHTEGKQVISATPLPSYNLLSRSLVD
jgi:hypothetical protein